MTLKSKTLTIQLADEGDNYPIIYTVSSRTTKGETAGWHVVELLDHTFDKEFTFRHDMLDKFIKALTDIKEFLNTPD